MIEYCKLQVGCMLIVLYVAFIYYRERYAYKVKHKETIFELLLYTGMASIIFDGLTAYTVNHLETISAVANATLHACFLCSLDAIVFLIFIYVLDLTKGITRDNKVGAMLAFPFFVNIIVVLLFIPKLTYRHGAITNYSMGISAYTCYIMVALYMLGTVVLLATSRKNMGHNKRITITTCMAAAIVVTIYQMLQPQALVTCLVPTFVIIGAYLNMENPLLLKLQAHNQEMVMGFATLVESKDGSTGGHIRRTTTYVELLAKELKKRGLYRNEFTDEYIKNLVMAAPMHDIGKIAIPDAILQKPGKLTEEEFQVMKTHSEKGGEIIKETFETMGSGEYGKIAYQVARYHHEKWNGKGYPEGLTRKEIPLCARIMAVADVFDAVSAKRCYRDAMSLDQCFEIIERGSGQDFDPFIAEVFLELKEEVGQVVENSKKMENRAL